MTRRLFLFENEGQYAQHQVINANDAEAKALTDANKAVEVSFGPYDDYRKQSQQLHATYKKTKEKIEKNDHPTFTDEVRQYELDKAFAEYEQQAKELQSEWDRKRSEMVTEAKTNAMKATVPISENDRQTASQIANRLALDIRSTTNALDYQTKVREAVDAINTLDDKQKTALQSEIDRVLDVIEAKAEKLDVKPDTRQVLSSVRDIRDMQLLGGVVADQLPNTVTTEFNTLNTVKKAKKTHNRYM